ncbi:MAG: hypothetical protein J7L25_08430 [Deltaproteobacteria bacterium]|nr:hypothetical protein [Candidatus Tharpella aukensis]
MPRLEIDSFPESNDAIETMEVKGVVYTRVVNPQAALDPSAPPALWVPSQVYQSGKHLAYTADLPKSITENTEIADSSLTGAPTATDTQTAESGDLNTEESGEELLSETTPAIPPLRRRALLFPTRTSQLHPEIATLLSLELENKLPLRVADCHDQALLDKGRLLKQRSEIATEIKGWLKLSSGPPEVQFILFLTTTAGRRYEYYTCTWIDAQTGDNVASFTFRSDLKGNLLLPLVPNDPVPLLHLVDSTTWWCRISSGDEENTFLLDAGHRSDLRQGRELLVFRESAQINDPQNKSKLGFVFTEPLGFITVVDFFGADGSLAQARTPLTGDFDRAYAVKIIEDGEDEINALTSNH